MNRAHRVVAPTGEEVAVRRVLPGDERAADVGHGRLLDCDTEAQVVAPLATELALAERKREVECHARSADYWIADRFIASMKIMSAALSAIMIAGALVLPETGVGMIEASTTRKPAMP